METEPNRSSGSIANPNSPWHTVILACFVAILSYCAAKLGGMLTIGPQSDWPLWLGNVFLASMLLLVPRRLWTILFAAAFAAYIVNDIQAGLSIRSIGLLVLSDTVEVLTAALCLSYAFGGVPRLDSVRALAKFSLYAVIVTPCVAAFFAALITTGDKWASWRISFFSEAIVYLTLMPAILGWFSKGPARAQKSRGYYLEAAGLIAGLAVFGYLAFRSREIQLRCSALFSRALYAVVRFAFRNNRCEHIGDCNRSSSDLGRNPRARSIHRTGAAQQCATSTAIFILHCGTFHGSSSRRRREEADQ